MLVLKKSPPCRGTAALMLRLWYTPQEQVYDLLGKGFKVDNVTVGKESAAFAPSHSAGLRSKVHAAGLKMRYTKSDGFFLENLHMVDCTTPEEVLTCFKEGVKHKVQSPASYAPACLSNLNRTILLISSRYPVEGKLSFLITASVHACGW